MKKKTVRKSAKKSSRSSGSEITYFKYVAVTFVIVLLIFAAKIGFQAYQTSNVLGASTFITDSGGDSQDTSTNQNQVQNQDQNRNTVNQPPTGENNLSPQAFRPGLPQEGSATASEQLKSALNTDNLGKVQFQSEHGNSEVSLQNNNSQLEIKNENGQVSVTAKDTNGNEVQLRTNSLEKINEALKNSDVQVGTSSANELTIRNGNVEAKTNFPLSINPTTNTLTVTTPAGVKDVAVLPQPAVQNLIQQGVISQVTTTTTATNGAQLQQVTLGLLNNQPVFRVIGVDNKKLLGLLPVDINKTAYVSAQNGQVVQTNENFVSSLLDLLSTP